MVIGAAISLIALGWLLAFMIYGTIKEKLGHKGWEENKEL